VARIGQRPADRVGLLSDTAFGVSTARPLLAPRTERDQLGDREVPGGAYFGVQTLRAVENFAISGIALRDFSRFIDAIAQACDEITAGRLHDQFVVDMIQGGAGTSTNMNVNEVIANRALEILGYERGQYAFLHPNDDVNCSQSTNDAYPTALKLGVFLASRDTLAAMAATAGGAARERRTIQPRHQVGPNAAARRRADDARPGIHCLRDDGPSGVQPHRRCRTGTA
jgi:aspartate ammonia-lyase